MQTRSFPFAPDGRSPAGAEIRYLLEGETGTMIHSTVPPGQVKRATVHATVSEFWHVLSGHGQIWRRDDTGEQTTVLERGVSVDIAVGTAFQYRCTGAEPLQFLCISMPRWPGDQEATVTEGPWKPTAPEARDHTLTTSGPRGAGDGHVGLTAARGASSTCPSTRGGPQGGCQDTWRRTRSRVATRGRADRSRNVLRRRYAEENRGGRLRTSLRSTGVTPPRQGVKREPRDRHLSRRDEAGTRARRAVCAAARR